MQTHRRGILVTALMGFTVFVVAAAPPKPPAGGVKLLPPATQPLSPVNQAQLETAVTALTKEVAALRTELRDRPALLALLPDVEIYLNALRYPLVYHEQIDVKKIKPALADGMERARQLRDGKSPWVTGGGPRGYLSNIDGSVQPYLLAVPKSYKPGEAKKYRVDFFCHGRGEDLLELKFINGKPGTAEDKFVVQPYGRYCCANKFAGEIDTLEILDSLKQQYPIDESRIVMTGFSMGGAAVWHLAVHYSDLWCATSPGAGFCETKIYQKLAEKGELATTPWYEQVLWHWYDAPDYIDNLANVPLIAYAGTDDPQQQSGTIMEKAAKEAGVPFARIWGKNVGHKYEPVAKKELDQRLDALAAKGQNPVPTKINFETWTLRYNRMFWITIGGMEHHWQKAHVEAEIDGKTIRVKTQNVTALAITLPTGTTLKGGPDFVNIDGRQIAADKMHISPPVEWKLRYEKTSEGWQPAQHQAQQTPVDRLGRFNEFFNLPGKRPGLQGPIDDAFLDHFIMVLPTGMPLNEKVGAWSKEEAGHAIRQWHNIFRGEAIVKSDSEITDADIAGSNLILWGDPSSNKFMARIIRKLPIGWNAKEITLGSRKFDAATHGLIAIYPNPLNPERYIVLNSGFTFREDTNSTNSRQVPKLPDYAVVDLTTPPSAHDPGKIAAAGFFGEKWELRDDDGKINP